MKKEEGRDIAEKPEWQTSLLGTAEILEAGRKPQKFLVTRPADADGPALGLIPEASYTLLAADSGHGKTWIALDLARLLAWPSGKPEKRWLGVYDVEPQGVLYLDRENGPLLIGRRLAGLGLPDGARLKLWPQQSDQRSKLRLDEDGTDAILACCQAHSLKVVFLDSLVRFHSADENDAAAMGEIAVQIQRLKSAGLTVIALHHNRKGGGSPADRMRGSGEITAAADTVLHFKKWSADPNKFTLSASKLRHVSQDDFREHWFERREPRKDEFEFVKGGNLSHNASEATGKKSKNRPRTADGNKERALEAIRLGGRTRAEIRDLSGMQNLALGNVLNQLGSEGKIGYNPGGHGKRIYFLQGETAPPPSSEGGAEVSLSAKGSSMSSSLEVE